MRPEHRNTTGWLAAIVVAHLLVSIVHGVAHARANVALPLGATLFVFVVILAGPLAGLAWLRFSPSTGAWMVGATMAAALVFGLINHFVIESPDHVAHVVGPWRAVFGATAGLLFITEALGAGAGAWCAIRMRDTRRSS